MKNFVKIFSVVACLTLLLATSCRSYVDVPYIQNSDSVDLTASRTLYDAKIMPKDILTITVNCPNEPKAAKIFNLITQTDNPNSQDGSLYNSGRLQNYLVDNDGTIDFPMLGRLKVMGMTKGELENYIADKVSPEYLKERPIVVVRMANYKISVLGEVAKPGTYSVSNGKVNIFEGLAMAGDLTIWGQRQNVKLIREASDGQKSITVLNLNDANIINSPYYQLQQNDVIYVTPNKTKAKNSDIGSSTSLWFTSVSILVSMASLLYNILK